MGRHQSGEPFVKDTINFYQQSLHKNIQTHIMYKNSSTNTYQYQYSYQVPPLPTVSVSVLAVLVVPGRDKV
jgi:hypothetical protein